MRIVKAWLGSGVCAAMLLAACGGGGGGATDPGTGGTGTGTGTPAPPPAVQAVRHAYSLDSSSDANIYVRAVDAADGRLTDVDSTRPTSIPQGAAIASDSRFLYLATTGSITTYALDPVSGKLSYRQDVARRDGNGPSSHVMVDPQGRFLYEAASTPFLGAINSYRIDPLAGTLSFVGSVQVPHNGRLAVDGGGRFVFAVDSQAGRIVTYRVGADGALTRTSATAISTDPAWTPGTLAADPKGAFLYALALSSDPNAVPRVLALEVDPASGSLGVVDSVPVPEARQLFAEPGGRFVYVASAQDYFSQDAKVSSYVIQRTTGGLQFTGSVPVASGLSHMVVDPDGKFAYIKSVRTVSDPLIFDSLSLERRLQTYSVNQSNGTLTLLRSALEAPSSAPVFAN